MTWPIGTRARLRFLLNASGDPTSKAFQLEYKKNGSGSYAKVPVGASVAEAYGTVTFQAIGTGANGSTTVAPTWPATANGYKEIAVITSGSSGDATPTAPDGTWTLEATAATTDGTYGVDTGPRRVTVFSRDCDGSESGTVTFSISGGNSCRGTISVFSKAGSGAWVISAQGANDSGAHTGISMTAASMNWNTGDAVLVANAQRVDNATQSSQSLTASGVTFGTRTNRAATAVTTGNDHRHSVDTFAAISGTSNVNAAPTWAYTASAAASSASVIVRLREYTAPATNEIYIDASANIAASAATSTTSQLTGGSGSFTAGKISDDTNPLPGIDIGSGGNTELEWAINTQAPAAGGDYYDFRVTAAGVALDTYTAVPRLTLASAGTPVGMAAETDSGFALAATQIRAAGQASETDSALALGGIAVRSTGLSSETDSAFALAPLQLSGVGVASETDAALALAGKQSLDVGLAAESDSALTLAPVQASATGRADETDAALALQALQIAPAGRADETDNSLALTALVALPIGLATETDSALALDAGSASGAGLAIETDTALALAALQIGSAGLASETDAALALAAVAISAVGLASESDAAIAMSPVQIAPVGRADEIDTALQLSSGVSGDVGLASETDAAFALLPLQIAPVGLATETDTALAPTAETPPPEPPPPPLDISGAGSGGSSAGTPPSRRKSQDDTEDDFLLQQRRIYEQNQQAIAAIIAIAEACDLL